MPCTAVSYSAGCKIYKTHANLPSRGSKKTGLFLIFCTTVEREFRNCTFYHNLILFFPSTFVEILGFARPCISSRGNLAAAGDTLRKGKLLHFTSEPRPLTLDQYKFVSRNEYVHLCARQWRPVEQALHGSNDVGLVARARSRSFCRRM